ncbi:MAG: heme A synthase [Acidithiobacillales bacterium SG8_45]|jgi:cytochrome c oxidase assembly protein subunit 15|nr:MAG: heme A synthase [Acidithiobacillales bacterium SG8_45]
MLAQQDSNRAIAIWLFVVAALIFSMVVLGGVTRLTRSGLSMVEWAPIMGVVPPITEAQWQETFDKYKQFPEYQKINKGMSVHEFKSIFWFEYSHRLLGRTIGLAFLIPFIFFVVRKQIEKQDVPKYLLMFVLGGLQGLLGWYMVKSGLVNRPHVSQYRLTAHLVAAIAIYSYILWVAWGLIVPKRDAEATRLRSLRNLGIGLTGLIILMIVSGGFVAGTKAGLAYNTFPTMNGYWVPEGLYAMQPWWLNWFENATTIQFNHRLIAWILILAVPAYWFHARRHAPDEATRLALHLLLAMLAIQVVLGITTLLHAVPVALGAAHQAGALLLLTTVLYVVRRLTN